MRTCVSSLEECSVTGSLALLAAARCVSSCSTAARSASSRSASPAPFHSIDGLLAGYQNNKAYILAFLTLKYYLMSLKPNDVITSSRVLTP